MYLVETIKQRITRDVASGMKQFVSFFFEVVRQGQLTNVTRMLHNLRQLN